MQDEPGTTDDPERANFESTDAVQPVYYRLSGCALVFGYAIVFTAVFVTIVFSVIDHYEKSGWSLDKWSELIEVGAAVGSFFAALYLSSWLIKHHLRLTLWATGGIVVGVLAIWGGWAWLGFRAHARELDRWKAIVADYDPPQAFDVPSDANAAVVYAEVARTFIETPMVGIRDDGLFVVATFDEMGEIDSEKVIESVEELDKYLDLNADSRVLLQKAGALPRCDWSVSGAEDASRGQLMLRHCHYLDMSANRFIFRGENDEAGADLLAILRATRHVRDLTQNGDYALANLPHSWATDTLRAIGNPAGLPYDALVHELQSQRIWETIRADLIRDTENWYSAYTSPIKEGHMGNEWEPYRRLGVLEFGSAWFLRQSRHGFEATLGSPHEYYGKRPEPPSWYMPRARVFGSAFTGVYDIDRPAEDQQEFRLAIAALRLAKYRGDGADWPDRWPDSLEMPIDPLSGQPFVYRRDEVGFTIAPPGPIVDLERSWHWD